MYKNTSLFLFHELLGRWLNLSLWDFFHLCFSLLDRDSAITGEEIQNGFFYRFFEDTSERERIGTNLAAVKVSFPGKVLVGMDYIGLVINDDEFSGFLQAAIDHPLQKDFLLCVSSEKVFAGTEE